MSLHTEEAKKLSEFVQQHYLDCGYKYRVCIEHMRQSI
jgi:hypothetical protein